MTATFIIVERSNGSTAQLIDDGRQPIDRGVRWATLPRALTMREEWDWVAGAIVLLPDVVEAEQLGRIDRERSRRIAAVLGPTSEIREMHRRKAAEAAAVLAGGDIAPLLDAEAAACGLTRAGLAATVLDQRAVETAAVAAIEAAARQAKDAVRAADTGEAKIVASAAAWDAIDG